MGPGSEAGATEFCGWRTKAGLSNHFNKSTPTGKSLPITRNRVKPPRQKYFCFPEATTALYIRHPVPSRGALRNVPARGGEAVDANGASDEDA